MTDSARLRRRRVLAAALVVTLFWLGHLAAEDWDFTPADYDALTSGGGDLRLDADSDWVPPAIGDNLLRTLGKLLDPKLQPPSTGGVNVRDFYHGHVVCPRPCDDELLKAISALDAADSADEAKALRGGYSVTPENLEGYNEAKRRSETRTLDLLAKFFRENCAIVYHTYEYTFPDGMRAGDPRRNIRTPYSGEPGGFVPPNPENSSSVYRNYCHLAQIAFLVDEQGRVHVTTGSTRDLSRVTGRPMQ